MKKLKLFKKGKKVTAVQTADKFSFADRMSGAVSVENSMYAALRENVPIIDAAIQKIVRLCGRFEVSCTDKTAERLLKNFLREVPCGAVGRGITAFTGSMLDRLLTYGTAVDEMVLDGEGRLCALYSADLNNVELCEGSPAEPTIYKRGIGGREKLPHPERVLVNALYPKPGRVYGESLLRGLPFLSEVLLKIYNSVGVNFERMGNMRFAVTYRPNSEGEYGQSRAEEIANAWSEAMSDKSSVRDFVAVGDVDIKVIGAEATFPEIEVPIRTILEQIVAKTGLPPFLLGLSWSSTERMSSQQADILTSELEYYRELITPSILKICRAYLRGEGVDSDITLEWDNISLQDETELSRARLYRAQADKIYYEIRGKANAE